MHAGKFGKMFLAQDESRIALGCIDPYGTLDMTGHSVKILATYEVGAGSSMNFGLAVRALEVILYSTRMQSLLGRRS